MSVSSTFADKTVTFANFDPNKQFASKPLWGMFDGYRFRTFTMRGHAVNAMHQASQSKLYRQGPGGWELVATKDEINKPRSCQNCMASTIVPRRWYNYSTRSYQSHPTDTTNEGKFVFRRAARKMVEPIEMLFVCPPCADVVDN